MKILFTGGTGFLGRNLVRPLSERYEIFSPSRQELNLLNFEEVKEYLIKHDFDIIIHAAIPNLLPGHADNESSLLKDSLKAFSTLVVLNKYYRKMLYFGSGAEFNKDFDIRQVSETDVAKKIPNSDYGFSKFIMNLITENNKKIINLRIFGCYGSTDADFKFLQTVINNVKSGDDILIRQDCYFDYICVEDLTPIICHFIDKEEIKYSAYNICSGNRYLLSDLAKLVIDLVPNCNSKIVIKDAGLNKEYTANNQRILEEMEDFSFTSIEEGLRAYLERELL